MFFHGYVTQKNAIAILIAVLPVISYAKNIDEVTSQCVNIPPTLTVDKVWGGTRAGFSAVESSKATYIAYYDKERWLTVAQINKCTGAIQRLRLNSQFKGWDAHNSITAILDSSSRLHIAGNMHVAPLVYARMSRTDDLQSLQLQQQVGREEERVTYPLFFKLPDGSLGFSYRYGQSGNGVEIINRFDGEKWSRWIDKPLFGSAEGGLKVNAYHTEYVKGPDDQFHVAWVWRQTPAVETNFNVNYARSPDLRNWYDSKGKKLTLPITPDNADVAANIPIENGLFNNIRLGFDALGRPIISYLKFDNNGNTQLWHARSEKDWKNYQSTSWRYRWDPRGGGSIPAKIVFNGVEINNGELEERVRHPKIGQVSLSYNMKSLKVEKEVSSKVTKSEMVGGRKTPEGKFLSVEPVRNIAGKAINGKLISWVSYPADNHDKPRICKIQDGCQYIFDLELNNLNYIKK